MNQTLSRRWVVAAVWLSVLAVMVGFVLPWAKVRVTAQGLTDPLASVAQGAGLQKVAGPLGKRLGRIVVTVKKGTKTVTGALSDLAKVPTQVRGFEIPLMTNRQDVQVVVALTEMLTGQQEIGAKSWLVYLLPALALLGGVLVTRRRSPYVDLVVGVVGLGVGGFGIWKLLMINTQMVVMAVTIGAGLWMSFLAYVSLGLSALTLAIRDKEMAPTPPRS